MQQCARCGAALAPGALACGGCHGLVHAARLEWLSARARMLENRRELAEARDLWLEALALLPAESAQAEWVRGNAERLARLAQEAAATASRRTWAKRLGPLAPLAIVLAKGKFLLSLFKLKFLLSLGTFVLFYGALYGAKFGVGFAILILVHEMGHFIDVKRRGLPADMPLFLPGLGAYVRWSALGVPTETRAYVSLAGPLAGCVGAAVCAALWWRTGDALWRGLAGLTALVNLLNLIPVWVLDGSQAIPALNKTERIVVAAAAVLLAALFGQAPFLLVAAGAAYRAFDKVMPPAPSRGAALYYVMVLAGLGCVMQLAPLAPPGS